MPNSNANQPPTAEYDSSPPTREASNSIPNVIAAMKQKCTANTPSNRCHGLPARGYQIKNPPPQPNSAVASVNISATPLRRDRSGKELGCNKTADATRRAAR